MELHNFLSRFFTETRVLRRCSFWSWDLYLDTFFDVAFIRVSQIVRQTRTVLQLRVLQLFVVVYLLDLCLGAYEHNIVCSASACGLELLLRVI